MRRYGVAPVAVLQELDDDYRAEISRSTWESEGNQRSGRSGDRLFSQRPPEIGCGAAGPRKRHFRRRACGDDPPAFVAGAGADVDHPVARRRHLHVVVDEDDAVAGVDQGVELAEQALDIGRV